MQILVASLSRISLDLQESTLERCLPIHRVVNGDAAIVVAAKECDLPVIANKLLDLCGFDRPSDILLTHPAKSRKITEAEIIIIAKRGKARVNLPADAWCGEERVLDPLKVAARRGTPEAKGRGRGPKGRNEMPKRLFHRFDRTGEKR